MNIKQILKTFCFHYFLIYGLTMMASFFWCLASGGTSISLDFFWKAMIFSLVADAPLFVFWSRREPTGKQTLIRIIIHGILLEILLPAAGWFIGMWRGVGGYFIFFATVLIVDASIFGITYLKMSVEAGNINTALRKRKMEKEKKEEEGDGFGEDNRDSQSE
ncbi:MAG: hypothetical protein K2O44_03465 [Clostridia bacterium]|nr:hypothetical protein [Clostridia bacterium]